MNVLRVYGAASQVDPAILERYRNVPVAALSDAMGRNAGVVGLHPIGNSAAGLGDHSVAGTALTVRTRPGDNLALHKALDISRPGDVIVVDARGDLYSSIMGDLMTRYAGTLQIAAVVIDGAVRDVNVVGSGTLPIYARGVSHIAPAKLGPGEIHAPVSIGGVPVSDGDVVVCDADGVTIVPIALALDALEAAEEIVRNENGIRKAIDEGRWDRTWVDQAATLIIDPTE